MFQPIIDIIDLKNHMYNAMLVQHCKKAYDKKQYLLTSERQ